MLNWLKNNWGNILIGLAGILIGYLLSMQGEQRIINAIATKIDELKNKNKTLPNT